MAQALLAAADFSGCAICNAMSAATVLLLLWSSVASFAEVTVTQHGVPMPTPAQLRYQRNEISALVHFNSKWISSAP